MNLTPKEIAQQLKRPEGEVGKQIGLKMNEGNKEICLNTYKKVKPKNGNRILEIGMGNGKFISVLLNMAKEIKYTGIDLSKTMVEEAQKNNQISINNKKVKIIEGTIDSLPFSGENFDCITTTNTIYFWTDPVKNARELLKILTLNGKIVIGYRNRDYMKELPIAKHGFKTYSEKEIEDILREAGFKQIQTTNIKEPISYDYKGDKIEKVGFFTIGHKL